MLFSDFLRALVSGSLNVILMLSLLQPKFGKKLTNITMAVIMGLNLLVATLCYMYGDLTLLTKLSLISFAILCFLIRPLFKDSFMQWLFSFITMLNIILCSTVLSFSISRFMPYPMYSNILVRILIILGISFLIRRYMHPLYRQMVTRWNIFFYLALAIFASFVYYFTVGEDIVQTLIERAVPIHLLVLITVAVYVSIFHSIKTITLDYELREENLRMKSNQDLLYLSASAMEDRINMLDEANHKSSIVAHDHRHFNNTLLELLEHEKIEEAIIFLRKQFSIKPIKVKNYCDNTAVNAAVGYYVGVAEDKKIPIDISIDIPTTLTVDSMEFAMVVSNLLENAIHASDALEDGKEKKIWFTCRHVGRLVLEISNFCDNFAILDENGYPIAKNIGHGIGTKSVLAFAESNDAELFYQIEDGLFRVRMLI